MTTSDMPARKAAVASTPEPLRVGRPGPRGLAGLLSCLLAWLLGTLAPELVRADPGADAPAASASLASSLARRERLLDDPSGARTRLERLGVDLQLFYHQLLSAKGEDGASSGASFGHSGSWDLFGRVDLDALAGWRGGRFLLQVKGQYDRQLDEEVGAAAEPFDDADFDEPVYVSQLWLGQELLAGRLRLQAGFLQQQTLVDRNAYANSEDRQFLSSFLDNDGLVPLPAGLAAAVIAAPLPGLEIAAMAADADNGPREAGFDTAFDGADSVSWFVEASVESPFARRGQPGRWRAGVALDGRARPDLATGRTERGHLVAWLSADQQLWASGPPGRRTRLGAFARLGHADPDVSPMEWFWSLGLELAAPLPSRERDVLGLGAYQAIPSPVYRSEVDPDLERETGLELYYALRALGWLVLTPDLQVIVDPGARPANGTVVLGTLRTRVLF